MEQNNINKWRQHLRNIRYPMYAKMTDEKITKMLFGCGNEQKALLKWVISELCAKECEDTNTVLLKKLLKYIYIPKTFRNPFINCELLVQKECLAKIWSAIFEELTIKKNYYSLDGIEHDFSVASTTKDIEQIILRKRDESESDQEDESEGDQEDEDFDEFTFNKNKISDSIEKKRSISVMETNNFKINKYLEHYSEFIECYEREIESQLLNSEVQNNSTFEPLQAIIPSLCSSYSVLEKFNKDEKKLLSNLERLADLSNKLGLYTYNNIFTEIYSQILATHDSSKEGSLEI